MRVLTMTLALAAFSIAATSIPAPATAAVNIFRANLTGVAEFPPNASPGTGFAEVTLDDVAHTLEVEITFADLIGTTTASHIHAATAAPGVGLAGVATQTPTFVGFPLGVHSGSYSHLFDTTLASTWNAPYLAAHGGTGIGAEAALLTALKDGEAYLNVHSTFAPGGEIRGFLARVPEPATWALMLAGFGLAGAAMRVRRKVSAT